MRISETKLVELLANQPVQPVGLVTRTPARLRKGGRARAGQAPLPRCPYEDVYRLADRSGFIGADYARVVNRQRERESRPLDADGDVETFYAERLWDGAGRRHSRHLVEHRTTRALYLVFYPDSDGHGRPVVTQSRYQLEGGTPLERADLLPWLIESAGQSQRQETAKTIHWRLIALSHLVRLRMRKREYLITHPAVHSTVAAKKEIAEKEIEKCHS